MRTRTSKERCSAEVLSRRWMKWCAAERRGISVFRTGVPGGHPSEAKDANELLPVARAKFCRDGTAKG
jgi:hypothetical protein